MRFCVSESNMERDKFLSPAEAKDFGIIDKILDHPPKFGGEGSGPKESEPTGESAGKNETIV